MRHVPYEEFQRLFHLLVGPYRVKKWSNRAFCGKSMKLGPVVLQGILILKRKGDLPNLSKWRIGSHFERWRPKIQISYVAVISAHECTWYVCFITVECKYNP